MIIISDFCKNTYLKDKTHLSHDNLIERVKKGWENRKQGYREGVYLVPIAAAGFFCNTKVLEAGDYLFGQYKSRVAGETPRQTVSVLAGKAIPANFVDAVVYSAAVLNEEPGRTWTSYEFEVVHFLAKERDEVEPMDTKTMLANHFCDDGSGATLTGWDNDTFVEKLKESYLYWRGRCKIH